MHHPFQSFSAQHFSILAVLVGLTYGLVYAGQRLDRQGKLKILQVMAGLTLSLEIIETIVRLVYGMYDYLTDLPLFLCDVTAIMLPFVIYRQNRKWIGILYFWAMAGTLQALVTPELNEGFPSPEFFRYFLMHGGIVATVFCTILFFRIRISWRDLLNAILYAQVYLVLIHLVNKILGSNYSYTVQKPYTSTILDYFGPWPWYILWGEVLMVALFLVLW
ncbi:MAG TPA: TIGR02206 family membrane protein, partial [Saprospiraceae bacterium]|nr:TIGR02206 family membrane protein [Saprospiraceae bacterium]